MQQADFEVKVTNIWEVECWRSGVLVWTERVKNLVPVSGCDKLLDATIKSGQSAPTWWVGLVDNASFSAFNFLDTMASHAGWAENTQYSEPTRQQYVPGTIANGYVDNAGSRASFSMTATATIRGGFLASVSTKGGSSGVLYGEAAFTAPRSVIAADVLIIKLACQITSS